MIGLVTVSFLRQHGKQQMKLVGEEKTGKKPESEPHKVKICDFQGGGGVN